TPPEVRLEIMDMLCTTMVKDLADMTPRRFLCHPIAQAFVRRKVPFIEEPQLSDVHPSLNNADHLRAYITQAQQTMFPAGTGWEGMFRLLERKHMQETERMPQDQYIRIMDEFLLPDVREKFRIVICMFPQRSHDLLKAQFVQSDISYKRVVGFKELEFVGWDEQSHTTIVYCRAYMTRKSAAAHLVFFRLLDQLVLKDTGSSLMFRHLHSKSIDVKDRQSNKQYLGMALYLQELAAKLPPHTRDLHQPHRYIHELEPYEHLHRITRLCMAHIHRNIGNSKTIPDSIKPKMRSLMCVTHPSWDATVAQIESSGKAGEDWIADKVSSKFAFEAMCQEKSFVPLDIWKAGPATTDLVESAHWSVYLEGLECSLTSAVEKGEHVDRLRMSSSNVSVATFCHKTS
ncbi:hypothetical protein BT96DRAFT_843773, partial [Gymnopus androsaceus JB14]